MVAKIANHKRIISANASPGFRRPKKRKDQRILSPNCTKNSCFTTFFRHTIASEIPMSAYRRVQTGPNTQLGGASTGFTSPGYHSRTDDAVNPAPITPASSHTPTAITIVAVFFLKNFFTFPIMPLVYTTYES